MPEPVFLATVDTEADDQWSLEGRRRLAVKNAACLPRLQALCDRFDVRPTYLVTHEMATKPEASNVLKALRQGGRCEIGAHLHPWSSPPYREEDLVGRYPSQLPDDLLARQMRELTDVIASELGVRPVSYRAGRHGFDARNLHELEWLGYTVDSSVDPLFNEVRLGGRAYAGAPVAPYHPDRSDVCRAGASPVLEVPVSSGTLPSLPKGTRRLVRAAPSAAVAAGAQASRTSSGMAAPVVLAAGGRAGARTVARPARRADAHAAVPFERAPARRQSVLSRRSRRRRILCRARESLRVRGASARRQADDTQRVRGAEWRRRSIQGMSARDALQSLAVRVCHVTPHLPPEQAANAILPGQLARELAAHGVTSSFVTHPSTRGAPPPMPGPVTFTARRGAGLIARSPVGALAAAGRMGGEARAAIGAADLVHLHSNGLLVEVAGRVARRAGRPSIITLYGTDVWDHDPSRHTRFRDVVRGAAARVFYSQALLEFATPLGLADPPASVIYAPVSEVFQPLGDDDRQAARRVLGVVDRRVVLTVKRLHPVAGYDTALTAFETIAREVPAAIWVIAGYGDLRDSIEADVRARGLGDRVRLLGLTPQEQLPQWYAAADLFLLASRVESWGAVTLEALASGTPVVATATAGSGEVQSLFPGDVILVPVDDAAALAREAIHVLTHGRRTTDDARRRIDDEFRVAAAGDAYLQAYRHALGH